MADWKERLGKKFDHAEQKKRDDVPIFEQAAAQAARFCRTIAGPALEELKTELEKRGRRVELYVSTEGTSMRVRLQDEEEIRYSIETMLSGNRVRAVPKTWHSEGGLSIASEGAFRDSPQDYDALSITKDEIITHFLHNYDPKA